MLGRKGTHTEAVLARLDIAAFQELDFTKSFLDLSKMQFLTTNNGFQPGCITYYCPPASRLTLQPVVGLPKTSETSLTFDKNLNRWLSIQNPNVFDGEGAAYLYYSQTDKVYGPYSRVKIFTIPNWSRTAEGVISYAFKIHPELNSFEPVISSDEPASIKQTGIAFSYNLNIMASDPANQMTLFQKQFEKYNSLYIAQFVQAKVILY